MILPTNITQIRDKLNDLCELAAMHEGARVAQNMHVKWSLVEGETVHYRMEISREQLQELIEQNAAKLNAQLRRLGLVPVGTAITPQPTPPHQEPGVLDCTNG